MHSVTDTERRPLAGRGPRDTTSHRQPRPADPDLANLKQRIGFLADLGDARGRRSEVDHLRQRWDHLWRDRAQKTAQWHTDASNLRLAIEREERYKS